MPIRKLFHLTHLDNVPGIAQRGLLCRKRIHREGIPYVDLSDPSCQSRRTDRLLNERHLDLHHFVPLFLNPRNPMLFRLIRSLQECGQEGELAILEISGQPAQWQSSLLADGIASSADTRLFCCADPVLEDALDWSAIRNPDWPDAPRQGKRKTMAEVLVNGALAPRHIHKVWVQKPSALHTLAQCLSPADLAHCRVDAHQELFYA
jgi:hypothetical protein